MTGEFPSQSKKAKAFPLHNVIMSNHHDSSRSGAQWKKYVPGSQEDRKSGRPEIYISHIPPEITFVSLMTGAASVVIMIMFNTLRPIQNGRHLANDTFKRIFLNENIRILIQISLKFVPRGPFNYIPAMVQIMAWRRPGDKPLSEPMMVRLPTHICVTRPQWVKVVTPGECVRVSKIINQHWYR